MAEVFELAIKALACTWVVLAITRSDGAFKMFYKLRKKFKLFECSICLSVYIALILYLLPLEVSEVLAVAGIASVISLKLW